MIGSEFLIGPERFWAGEAAHDGPLAVIDLGDARDVPGPLVLPPCPVIGIGDRSHPLAAQLDAIVEPPFTLEGVVRQILGNPQAAAVFVQLLRALPQLDLHHGLTCESMAYGLLQGSAEHGTWLATRPPPPTRPGGEGRVRAEHMEESLHVILDHAESGNAIDRAMRDRLHEIFAAAAADSEPSGIVLRAEGRTFSLGAELEEFGTTSDPAHAHAIRQRTLPARMIALCADRLETHIQGGCVGAGLEMAAFSHRIVASRDAWFHLPELAMGMLPGAGGCVSLTRRIGRQRTALMVLSGKRVSSRLALEWGLVDAVVDALPVYEGGPDVFA